MFFFFFSFRFFSFLFSLFSFLFTLTVVGWSLHWDKIKIWDVFDGTRRPTTIGPRRKKRPRWEKGELSLPTALQRPYTLALSTQEASTLDSFYASSTVTMETTSHILLARRKKNTNLAGLFSFFLSFLLADRPSRVCIRPVLFTCFFFLMSWMRTSFPLFFSTGDVGSKGKWLNDFFIEIPNSTGGTWLALSWRIRQVALPVLFFFSSQPLFLLGAILFFFFLCSRLPSRSVRYW